MTKAEYAKQASESGWKVVYSAGTWWLGVKPFYYVPLHMIEPLGKEAAPPISRSLIGYQHIAKDEQDANCHISFMMMREMYDIGRLSSSTRNRIRKGLKNLEIKAIRDMGEMTEMGLEINRSALPRQMRMSNHSRLTDKKKWARNIATTFGKDGWEDWGAYKDGRLVAYLRGMEVEDTMYLAQACGHADFLKFHPNDALYHCFLESVRDKGHIKQIVNGYEVAKETLNEFKRKFGFEAVKLPAYRWLAPLVRPVLWFTRYRFYIEQGK